MQARSRELVPLQLPQLGMGMLEGEVVEWFVNVGDAVASGDVMVEIEASKTTSELVAPVDGIVAELLVQPGEMVPVNTVLATITQADSEVSTPSAAGEGPSSPTGTTANGPDESADAVVVEPTIEAPDNAAGPSADDDVAIPMTGVRLSIARSMYASLQNTAQLTLFTEIDVTDGVAARLAVGSGGRPSMTATLVAAACRALAAHPQLNASVSGDTITLHASMNVGIATARENGLIVPVVRNAAALSLQEVDTEARRLVGAAREDTLTLDEVTGGTFTITSLGSQGIDFFTPILNPPQAAILGVGRIREAPARSAGGLIEWRQTMGFSLTIDHRAVDGAPGAEFLLSLAEAMKDTAAWAFN